MVAKNFLLSTLSLISLYYLSLDLAPTFASAKPNPKSTNFTIRLPYIRPEHSEQYLCMGLRVPSNKDGHYVVGIDPVADVSYVHHMLVYACESPGVYERDTPNLVWECGSMMRRTFENEKESKYIEGSVCDIRGEEQLMYGWALEAPGLKMPKGVGYKVGGDTNLNYIVIQVHYGHADKFKRLPELTDNSGLILETIPAGPGSGITKRAGVLLLLSYGYVEKGKSRHEIWCQIEEDIVIHPFKYRVHTHRLGTKVYGAKIGNSLSKYSNSKYENNDLSIGQGDPQKPNMFYDVKDNNMTLTRGDSVYAYCDYYNPTSKYVDIGQKATDEMCNYYVLYWTDSPRLLYKRMCTQRNPSMARSLYTMLQ